MNSLFFVNFGQETNELLMSENANPYQSPTTKAFVLPEDRLWREGVESNLALSGLLQRRIVIARPIEVTIEYFARGLRDRILVDGKTVVSIIPLMWFKNRFEFEIPCADRSIRAVVRIKVGRFLKLKEFEVSLNDQIVFSEVDGKVQIGSAH